MQSFRTEIENPIVEKDILELERKIRLHKEGKIDEESFRSLRLARGVYGQRQSGVQMVRIKFPLGIITPNQLRRVAEIADKYANGNLHLTTRQDIQLHYVSLDDTPQLWEELEQDKITLREACGNTVRNITTSPFAGIDPHEPFDVSNYAWTLFEFFLRNPIAQDMGRKFKIAVSASEKDLALTYMHDLGLIPKIQNGEKGFKVLIGGGLGAQPALAHAIYEFLPVDKLIPFSYALVKLFDQYGERNRRNKARFKFLVQQEGIDRIVELLNKEILSQGNVETTWSEIPVYNNDVVSTDSIKRTDKDYEKWLKTNVYAQKQEGFWSIAVKIRNGDISSGDARKLADIIEKYSTDSSRVTIEQNLLIRSVSQELLPAIYKDIDELKLSEFGSSTIKDITACPGTETCNLGITGTYAVAKEIELFLSTQFEDLILNDDLKIKISGCMNSCGQHAIADIGLHGSSIRSQGNTFPALQLLLGGKNLGDGKAQIADKVIKLPTKRIIKALELILLDYKTNSGEKEFNEYYNLKGKIYFYDLLKELADVTEFEDYELIDWSAETKFKPEIGVGECAGVKIDLVQTLLFEAKEKIDEAIYFLENSKHRDALYTAYTSTIQTAKAYLVKKGEKTNSRVQIVNAFESYFPQVKPLLQVGGFNDLVDYRIEDLKEEKVSEYISHAEQFQLAITRLIKEENEV